MNRHLFESDWDYYDQFEEEKARKEAQDEHDADYADSPTCDEDY